MDCLATGMTNSPSFCQNYVSQFLDPIKSLPNVSLFFYMDDIILGAPHKKELENAFQQLQDLLNKDHLTISKDKFQWVPPFKSWKLN